ncbi:hypothetical protein [Ramlibacter rhizophilus]|uniref:Uncharacterized protein n=1 Tax=Ramlibacter rhizophilus TaxID=1781167 RepID=A0A4Z0BF41_9BURK|nr:hypothetical protein [Ramlibacter rhizophilus]TFY97922.1 hypothetical protein EZ242_15820 [Ramlibacter rhizophilus]
MEIERQAAVKRRPAPEAKDSPAARRDAPRAPLPAEVAEGRREAREPEGPSEDDAAQKVWDDRAG